MSACATTLFETEILHSKPFVKWVGGKRFLIDSILSLMPKTFNAYFEPFVGGGALFFSLKNRGILENRAVFLNDKNQELMNTYQVIQKNPDELLHELQNLTIDHNKETFYRIRELDRQQNFKDLMPTFRAARFIYLNKTCFNGLCRYNAKGEFNAPMGSYKNPKIYEKHTILEANNALKDVEIFNADFKIIMDYTKKSDFVYFDPPYYPLNKTSSFVSYTDIFLEDEQIRLFNIFKELDSIGVKVLQSNSDTMFIRELYQDFQIIEVQANRAINCKGDRRGKISELLIRGNYE